VTCEELFTFQNASSALFANSRLPIIHVTGACPGSCPVTLPPTKSRQEANFFTLPPTEGGHEETHFRQDPNCQTHFWQNPNCHPPYQNSCFCGGFQSDFWASRRISNVVSVLIFNILMIAVALIIVMLIKILYEVDILFQIILNIQAMFKKYVCRTYLLEILNHRS